MGMGKGLEAMADAITASGPEGAAAVEELKKQFEFVESEEFKDEMKNKYNEAGGGEPLAFEQFYPLIKEAASEFGEKLGEDEARDAFKDLDADGSGTMDPDEFGIFVILVVMMAAGRPWKRLPADWAW